MESKQRPELIDFQGVSMTRFVTDNYENIKNFQARPDDIFIVSYPKSGTTWVSYILDLLYFGRTSQERQTSVPLFFRVPNFEICFYKVIPENGFVPKLHTGQELVEKLSTSPRLIQTHLPIQFLPKTIWEQNCKVIYIGRNAKACAVSYFHMDHYLVFHPEPGDWDSYLKRFMEGKMVYGSWYDHVNSWWKMKQTYPNLHYMFYEDLSEDTGLELDKLCSFLGLSPSAEEKEDILGKVSFEQMKINDMVNLKKVRESLFRTSSFMRKGKVSDWRNLFTGAQNEEFDEDYKKKMKDPTLQFRCI